MRQFKSCEYCGTQLPGDAKYCASCGNFVTGLQPYEPPPDTRALPYEEEGILARIRGRVSPLTRNKLLAVGALFIFTLLIVAAARSPGFGDTPSPIVSASPTIVPTAASPSHRISIATQVTLTPTVTATPTSSPTKKPTITPTETPAPTKKPTKTPTATPTPSKADGLFIYSKASISKVYHYPWCPYVAQIKEKDKATFSSSAQARAAGYHQCSRCHPP